MAAPARTIVPSSSSSSSSSRWIYDVFLSFRGEDTRYNFTRNLYARLVEEGIKTFKDDENLKKGKSISSELEKAIKDSRFFIIIFSKNYANSRWCLEELALIMERSEKHGQKVFPIFLADADPLTVRCLKRSFGEAIGRHEEKFDQKMVQRWTSALRAAGGLPGTKLEDVGWNYDVFLSYQGEETETNFASNLSSLLERANIKTFKQDEYLKREEQISAALMKGIKESRIAIKESRIAIIIFSMNYASSRRCLEELALIMECMDKRGQEVFPVFLAGVEPSNVRRQTGSFGEPFLQHEECFDGDVVETWRSALRQAGELSGWPLKDSCDERKLIENIVEEVLKALDEHFTRPTSQKSVIEMEIKPMQNQLSTQLMLQRMLDCICDPRFGIVGVYGMGGVGKTTLAKKINNHFLQNPYFETVIMITVSTTPDIRSIRTRIAERLGLDILNTTEDGAREILLDALRKKKFLLILDDLWDILEFENVGIPHPRSDKEMKILVISRNLDTCTDMGAKETIKVQPLSEAESWNLFVEVAGDHVVDHSIRSFAEKIVEKCEGLPLAIVTVARAMANRHRVGEWANAEREMKESVIDIRGMKDKVLALLKFSFDRLEDNMLRSLFLYCACFPEDYNLRENDILDYCVGEGAIDRLGSLTAARNKGVALIGSLKIACMLENGEDEGTVRMHDMMRELALWITSSEFGPQFLIRTGESFKEPPQVNEWVNATKISLMDTQIGHLPEVGERCPRLITLLLRHNRILTTIPLTNFFQHMDNLSVLDLSNANTLEYLPDSLSYLVNLWVLRLSHCSYLRSLPAMGQLRQLQVLDLSHCYELDQQILGFVSMGGVCNLRYLDVSFSKVSIPMGVISHLLKLEELRLFPAQNILWNWSAFDRSKRQRYDGNNEEEKRRRELSSREEGDDHQNPSINIIDVGELSHLTQLRSLRILFKGIIISDWFRPLAEKITHLQLDDCTVRKQDALLALNKSQNLQHLRIYKCLGLTCVPSRSNGSLEIWDCEELEKVLDGAEAYHDSFQRLDSLYLGELPKLESICVGVAPSNCFGNLQSIEIIRCHRLKMVFTKEMPCRFPNLAAIDVSACDRMEAIIEVKEDGELASEGSNNRVISPFPKLRSLRLWNLPELADVCRNYILHCPLINNNVSVEICSKLKKNPLHICNTDGLLVIEETTSEIKVLKEEIQEI